MNIRIALLVGCIGLTAISDAWSQTSPSERRAFSEYTSPDELVSIAPSTPLDRALAALSEVSKQFIGKVIVDTKHRSMPINVDIQAMQWRDALEMICHKNALWYTEFETYIEIVSLAPEGEEGGKVLANRPTFGSREVRISAVFFEVNLTRLDEVGINWSFMKSTSNYDLNLDFFGGDKVTAPIFQGQVTPQISFANMDFVANLFSSHDLGEVLSGPQVVVRSGEAGRIQVGQDFSIKERDFAGNLIDRFYSAGTIINVTPTVITEQGVNFVHMDVSVERGTVTPSTVSTIVNKTQAETELLLLDNEEAIIGGLYNSETSSNRQGIPFLKDLPPWFFGLRYLFGYEKETVTKKELVILLKAEIVPTLQERIAVKAEEDRIFERWLQEREETARRIRGK
jgi:type IV pilus assembly protein PilQ